MLRKVIKNILYLGYLLIMSLLILEVVYRNYWIDFYRPELVWLNDKSLLDSDAQKPCILAFGDSFTANSKGYVSLLRDSFPEYRIINAGISGTTVKQTLLPLRLRTKEFSPRAIIYQIYLGNDLLEFRHPTDSDHITRARRYYWWLVDRIRVIGFLNYRLLHYRQKLYRDLPTPLLDERDANFDPRFYSARTKMHISAEPQMLEDVVFMKGKRRADIEKYVDCISDQLSTLPDSLPVIIVVVPHCAQVNEKYRSRMVLLGAQLSDQTLITQTDYPFFEYLQAHINRPNVQIFNPISRFREAEKLFSLYFDNDPHLNANGQEVLGKYLVDLVSPRLHPGAKIR